MTRRRRIVAITLALLAPTVLVFGACSFPEVTFSASEVGTPETGVEGSVPGVDGGSSDVSVPDATVRDEASAVVDAEACAKRARCDCDQDGYLIIGCDAGDGGDSGVDAKAKPGDCDDLDPLRHPGADFTKTVPQSHGGDWDCNTIVDKVPPQAECKGVGLTGCIGSVGGFVDNPECGVTGDTYDCVGSGTAGLGTCFPTKLVGTGVTRVCK